MSQPEYDETDRASEERIYMDIIPETSEPEENFYGNDKLTDETAVRQNMLNHYLGQQSRSPIEGCHHQSPLPNHYSTVPHEDPDVNDGHHYEQPRRQSLVQSINQERERYQSLERNINQHQSKYKSLEKGVIPNHDAPQYPNVYNTSLMQYPLNGAGPRFESPVTAGPGKIVQTSPAASRMAINGSDPDLSLHVPGMIAPGVRVVKPGQEQPPCITRYIILSCVILCCCNPVLGGAALWFALKARRSAPKNRKRLNRLSLIINICGVMITLIIVAAGIAFFSMSDSVDNQHDQVKVDTDLGDSYYSGSGDDYGSGSGSYLFGQSGHSGFGDDEDYKIPSRRYDHHHNVHAPYIEEAPSKSQQLDDFVFDGAGI